MQVLDDWLLTPQRAAIHVPTATAVIADLHLGYNQARRRVGEAIPCRSIESNFGRLTSLLALYHVNRLVIAGDLFEESYNDKLTVELENCLERARIELAGVVPGNHDREIQQAGTTLPIYPVGMDVGAWRVIHGDGKIPRGKVVLGHFHPILRWHNRLAAPCYLVKRNRLVLPAFSEDAAGVDVLGQGGWLDYRCCAIAGDKVLDFGAVATLKRRRAKVERRKG